MRSTDSSAWEDYRNTPSIYSSKLVGSASSECLAILFMRKVAYASATSDRVIYSSRTSWVAWTIRYLCENRPRQVNRSLRREPLIKIRHPETRKRWGFLGWDEHGRMGAGTSGRARGEAWQGHAWCGKPVPETCSGSETVLCLVTASEVYGLGRRSR